MPATVTLSTTTLTYGIGPGDGYLTLGSVSGIVPGYALWIDSELMEAKEIIGSTRVRVIRGIGGSAASQHSSSALVTIGRQDQFYSADPVGAPLSEIPVSPYINTVNGKVWLSQGDATSPDGLSYRWWQNVTTAYGFASLGVRSFESAPTSST